MSSNFGSYWAILGPNMVTRLSKLYFWDILIKIDNFHFYCHDQFSLIKFSKMHSRTNAHLENSLLEVGQAHLLIMHIYIFEKIFQIAKIHEI